MIGLTLNNWLTTLFSSTGFEPHSTHFIPNQLELMWILILGNIIIAMMYFLVPLELLYIYFKRPDFPFRWVFCAVPFFGFWCSITHIVMFVSFWYPLYYLQGVVDFITGVVSLATLLAIIPASKKVLQLRTPDELEKVNQKLREEIRTRLGNKASLAEMNLELLKANRIVSQKNQELYSLNQEMIKQELEIILLKEKLNKKT